MFGCEAKTVRHCRRNEDRGRRGERQLRRLVDHFAAAALDQKDLKQIAMPMRANGPVVDRGSRGNGFNVNEIERLIVRRIAVEVEQGQRGGHAASISRSRRRRSGQGPRRMVFCTKSGSPPMGGLPLSSNPASAVHAAMLAALPLWPPWPGLLLAALLLLTGLLSALLLLAGLALTALLRVILLLLRVAADSAVRSPLGCSPCFLESPRPTDDNPPHTPRFLAHCSKFLQRIGKSRENTAQSARNSGFLHPIPASERGFAARGPAC